ncbi:MAG: NifB/NifX family molybdenum-iron cluster-binding protein [Lachnospiraceae bacterium]|nr:NifB/NifX family molybdenum-iron cluster-binding protein [Lachnospiraceae bacterium]
MKIAVPCDEKENVFPHFGHAKQFKIYELMAGGNISAMVVSASGNGHKETADFLIKGDVKLLICDGIGEGAIDALDAAGIMIVPGVSGTADQAVKDFLEGILAMDNTPTCEGGCGGHDGGCGSGCGGCHGCH